MKTVSLFLVLVFVAIDTYAHPTSTKREKGVSVVSDIRRVRLERLDQLPAPVKRAVSYLPEGLYNKVWSAAAESICGKNPVLLYEVSAKGPKGQLRAFYNAQGKLDHFTERLNNQPVPSPVMVALTRGFPGWKLTRTEEQISENAKQSTIVYHVFFSKGHKNRSAYFDKDGKPTQSLLSA